jgi:hypothetical protein
MVVKIARLSGFENSEMEAVMIVTRCRTKPHSSQPGPSAEPVNRWSFDKTHLQKRRGDAAPDCSLVRCLPV